jgi:hypothetical protein
LDSLDTARTWDVGDKVDGGKKVGGKWVFKVKRLADGSIDKFKARLVAQDFPQDPGFDFDKTYTPVIGWWSLRLLLTITVIQDWHPQQVAVNSAILYGDLDEKIYLILREGHQEKEKTP